MNTYPPSIVATQAPSNHVSLPPHSFTPYPSSEELQQLTFAALASHTAAVRLQQKEYENQIDSGGNNGGTAASSATATTKGFKVFLGGLRYELLSGGKVLLSWLVHVLSGGRIALPEGFITIHTRRKGLSRAQSGGGGDSTSASTTTPSSASSPSPSSNVTANSPAYVSVPTGCISIFIDNERDAALLLGLHRRAFCGPEGIFITDTAESTRLLMDALTTNHHHNHHHFQQPHNNNNNNNNNPLNGSPKAPPPLYQRGPNHPIVIELSAGKLGRQTNSLIKGEDGQRHQQTKQQRDGAPKDIMGRGEDKVNKNSSASAPDCGGGGTIQLIGGVGCFPPRYGPKPVDAAARPNLLPTTGCVSTTANVAGHSGPPMDMNMSTDAMAMRMWPLGHPLPPPPATSRPVLPRQAKADKRHPSEQPSNWGSSGQEHQQTQLRPPPPPPPSYPSMLSSPAGGAHSTTSLGNQSHTPSQLVLSSLPPPSSQQMQYHSQHLGVSGPRNHHSLPAFGHPYNACAYISETSHAPALSIAHEGIAAHPLHNLQPTPIMNMQHTSLPPHVVQTAMPHPAHQQPTWIGGPAQGMGLANAPPSAYQPPPATAYFAPHATSEFIHLPQYTSQLPGSVAQVAPRLAPAAMVTPSNDPRAPQSHIIAPPPVYEVSQPTERPHWERGPQFIFPHTVQPTTNMNLTVPMSALTAGGNNNNNTLPSPYHHQIFYATTSPSLPEHMHQAVMSGSAPAHFPQSNTAGSNL